jgi:presequence protease
MKQLHNKTATESGKSVPGSRPETTHGAFEWLRSQPIDSLNIVVEEYRHKLTGAQHIHLVSDNPENVFLVALRTVPANSTGVAHILEHTTLCGSERYPVRDPFFMMIRRSLNTFMNAFTSSDWTAYPFASQNRKDFNNLLEVYLDAVFFARLHELDFSQEGHRVEFEEPDNPDSNLVYKGVVFNEMKGSMSSTVNALWQKLNEHLFPTTTYHYNSGGEPENIPELTYAGLKQFYKTHYHPGNAVFMSYGNIPAHELQAVFEEKVLCRFQRLDQKVEVADEKRFDKPKIVEAAYALDESEAEGDKTHIVISWLLGKCTDSLGLMRAHLLASVLLDNSASPMRRALETTSLGSAPSPLCGLEDSNREMNFMCGLEGSKPENAEATEQLVMDVIRDIVENGVPTEKVEAVLHQLELGQREIKGDGYPYGLQLILEGLSAAIHRGDPVSLLNLDPVLDQLREDIKNPEFIKNLAKELLLNNPHRVRLTMSPDTTLAATREKREAEKLRKLKDQLGSQEKTQIINRAAELAARQQQEDDPEILPKVGIDDIPKELKIPEGEVEELCSMPATFYAQGTNGLCYQQIVTNLPALKDSCLTVLPLYTRCLTELGVGDKNYLEIQAWQDAISGGINASTTVHGNINDAQKIAGYFVLSGKSLTRNHRDLTQLLMETFERSRYDEHDRIRELIAQERARAEQSVTGNGHGLAMSAACSGMSPAAALSHRLRGLAGIHALKNLDDSLDDPQAIRQLADRFSDIHHQIVEAPRQILMVGEKEGQAQLQRDVEQIWSAIPISGKSFNGFMLPSLSQQVKQFWVTSTQVNFCAKAYATVPVEHEDAPALTVLGGFLRNGYLHRAIREQGGAYGGGAGQDSDIAAFRFFSYRDPRLVETLNDFDQSIAWLVTENHEERQLEEAILGVISSIDKPGSPAGEAKKAFHNNLYGRKADQLRQFRERILEVTIKDLKRVGSTYLKPELASTAVISNSTTHDQLGDLEMEVLKL